MKTSQKKRLLGGIRKTKQMWKRWREATEEEERLQSNTDVTVQCIDFCEVTTTNVLHAVLQRVPSGLRGGTFRLHPRVLVATLCFQENPHRSLQLLHAAMLQILPGAYIPP